jgi:hypothetical protein
MFCAVPIPLVTWPAFVAVGSVMAGIGIGFGLPFVGTYDDRNQQTCCFGGIPRAISVAGWPSSSVCLPMPYSKPYISPPCDEIIINR